jgi:hypothetical protein
MLGHAVAFTAGTLWASALSVAWALAAIGRGLGRAVRACGHGITSAVAMGAVATARGVGRGGRMLGHAAVLAAGTLWALRLSVASALVVIGRGLGRAVRVCGQGFAFLWGWALSVVAGLTTPAGGPGQAVPTDGHELVSARAPLAEATTRGEASVVSAEHSAGRGAGLSVRGVASTPKPWAWVRGAGAWVAASVRAPGRGIEAWVTRHATPLHARLRAWSPGAVLAVLGLVVFTLVMALWPISYEPPTLESPPPLRSMQSMQSPERAPDLERKAAIHVDKRSGARPRSVPRPPSPAAREPVSFTTARPSDR